MALREINSHTNDNRRRSADRTNNRITTVIISVNKYVDSPTIHGYAGVHSVINYYYYYYFLRSYTHATIGQSHKNIFCRRKNFRLKIAMSPIQTIAVLSGEGPGMGGRLKFMSGPHGGVISVFRKKIYRRYQRSFG